jgi:hypothetical protein
VSRLIVDVQHILSGDFGENLATRAYTSVLGRITSSALPNVQFL